MKKNNKIKIAYCVSGLAGGVCNVIMNYLKYMPDDYDITIITQSVASEKYLNLYQDAGYKIITIPSKSESIFKNFKALYKEFKKENYDIVHAHMTLTNCFPLFIALICGIHVRISHSHMACKKNFKSLILSFFTRIMATDYFACGVEAGKYLYGNHNFIILNNAIDLGLYSPDIKKRNKERLELNVAEDEILLGHVGRFTYQKNHVHLINIFEKYHEHNSKSKLILIGSGEELENIKKIVFRKNLEEYVIFTGVINDVYNKIQALDLFILPSYYEGLCLAAVEVQACGIPCMFSDNVSFETKINDNVFFFSLDDDIENIIKMIDKVSSKKQELNEEAFKNRGFDIRSEANKLDIYYKLKIKKWI